VRTTEGEGRADARQVFRQIDMRHHFSASVLIWFLAISICLGFYCLPAANGQTERAYHLSSLNEGWDSTLWNHERHNPKFSVMDDVGHPILVRRAAHYPDSANISQCNRLAAFYLKAGGSFSGWENSVVSKTFFVVSSAVPISKRANRAHLELGKRERIVCQNDPNLRSSLESRGDTKVLYFVRDGHFCRCLIVRVSSINPEHKRLLQFHISRQANPRALLGSPLAFRKFSSPARLSQLPLKHLELAGCGSACISGIFSRLCCSPIHKSSLSVHLPPLVVDKESSNDRGQERKKSDAEAKPSEQDGSSFKPAEVVGPYSLYREWLWNGLQLLLGLLLCWWCGQFTLGGGGFDWSDRLYRRLSGHGFSDRERVLISFACFLGGLVSCSHAVINCTTKILDTITISVVQ